MNAHNNRQNAGSPRSVRNGINTGSSSRQAPLDVARGIAVLGMIYMHLVPTEAARTSGEAVWTHLARLLDGKSAALFCILAGMSWSIQAQRAGGSPRFQTYVFRRSLALTTAGLLLHLRVWPTEILIPLALMMPLALTIRRGGAKAIAVAILFLLIAIPIFQACFGSYATLDWNEDGSHLADHTLGWVTFRYLLFDGNYPLMPWLGFPLVGMLLAVQDWTNRARSRMVVVTAVIVMVSAHSLTAWVEAQTVLVGIWVPYVTNTWVPTSIPFLLITGGYAVAVIAALFWWQSSGELPRAFQPLACLGRTSLTHYLLHIFGVILPLRLTFPGEEWPVQTGLFAFALYVAIAIPLSALWFRRFARGPFEALWAIFSGPVR